MINKNNLRDEKSLPLFVKYLKVPYTEFFPKIFWQRGYIFEKIDGSLTQVRNTSSGIIGGTKANYLKGEITKVLWFPKFLKWMRSNESLTKLPFGVILFGEWLNKGKLNYDRENLNKFYFIDMGFVNNNKIDIFNYDEAIAYLKKWGIGGFEIPSPIERESFFNESEINELVLSRKSQLGSCEIEGVVLKNYFNQEFAKFLHPKHSEIRGQEKTLEAKYITSLRVRKSLLRLREEKIVKRPTLEELALEVAKDINEETHISFSPKAISEVIRIRGYYHLPAESL